ncbi:transmembrane protein [Rhynchospora pubera]|uniref:Transmembrane protein n=1 Tax=Rhynchospora pubera TaxID=906938 RepID=A0AAV8G6S7_9POAL|nr:transmembrane protein [Rhynchospora pubera]
MLCEDMFLMDHHLPNLRLIYYSSLFFLSLSLSPPFVRTMATGLSSVRSPAIVWISSAALFFLIYLSAMNAPPRTFPSFSSPPTSNTSAPAPLIPSSNSDLAVEERRLQLYDKMSRDLDEKGAVFLKGGETSQSLSLSDIFELRDGVVVPVLKAASPPVRANVLYLSPEFSKPISEAVKEVFLPYFDGAIWFQNATMYHFSMFHASHHLTPVVATKNEIEAEAEAVKRVTQSICPLKIKLDRVVLTSTGVLLGCWQVVTGTDPADIREKLREALPRAPAKQLYDLVLLHTSFARILGHPKLSEKESKKPFDQLQFFHELVARANTKLRGFEATVTELWFVEEYDVLALALNGKMKTRRFLLGCNGDSNH